MKRSWFLIALMAAVGGLSVQAQQALVRLESLLPEETAVLLLVEDFPALRKKGEHHAWYRLWQDEEVKAFFGPLRQNPQFLTWQDTLRTQSGHSLDEIASVFKGQIALALPSMKSIITDIQARSRQLPPGENLLLAHVGGAEPLLKDLIAKQLAQVRAGAPENVEIRETTQTNEGETVYVQQRVKDGQVANEAAYAIVNGIWVAGVPVAAVSKMVATIKAGGAKPSLLEAKEYVRVREKVKSADALGFVHLEKLLPPLLELLQQELQKHPEQLAQWGVSYETITKGLGLDVLKSGYLAVRDEGQFTDFYFGVHYTELRGLVKLLTYGRRPASRPRFLNDQFADVTVATFNLPEYWGDIKQMLTDVSPQAGNWVNMSVTGVSMQAGIDIEKEMLGNFGDEVVLARALRPAPAPGEPVSGELDNVIIVKLKDPKVFEQAAATFTAFATGGEQVFEQRDYLEDKINTFKGNFGLPAGQTFTYAISNGYLVVGIGSPALLETTLQALKNPPAKVFWDRPEVKSAVDALPLNPFALQAADTAADISAMLATLANVPGQAQRAAKWVDFTKRPKYETLRKYCGMGVSGAYTDGEDLLVRARLTYPPPQ